MSYGTRLKTQFLKFSLVEFSESRVTVNFPFSGTLCHKLLTEVDNIVGKLSNSLELVYLQVFIKRVKTFALRFSAGDRAVSNTCIPLTGHVAGLCSCNDHLLFLSNNICCVFGYEFKTDKLETIT